MATERLLELARSVPPEKAPEAEALLERLIGGPDRPRLSPEERRARVDALFGRYAHAHSPVDEFLRRRREDDDLDEGRPALSHQGFSQ